MNFCLLLFNINKKQYSTVLYRARVTCQVLLCTVATVLMLSCPSRNSHFFLCLYFYFWGKNAKETYTNVTNNKKKLLFPPLLHPPPPPSNQTSCTPVVNKNVQLKVAHRQHFHVLLGRRDHAAARPARCRRHSAHGPGNDRAA